MATHVITTVYRDDGLLPFFIRHYQELKFDRIHVLVNEDTRPGLGDRVRETVEKFEGVYVADVYAETFISVPRTERELNYVMTIPPSDWIVIADLDDFNLYPVNDIRQMVEMLEEDGSEWMPSVYVDRVAPGGHLPSLDPDRDIWEQFPLGSFIIEMIVRGTFVKVSLQRPYVEIDAGHHRPTQPGHYASRWRGETHHFKWHQGVIERYANRLAIVHPLRLKWWGNSYNMLKWWDEHGNLLLDRPELRTKPLRRFEMYDESLVYREPWSR